MESIERLCKIVERQLDKAVDVLEQDGKIQAQDVDYIDKLTHTLKSIKTTLAMEGYGNSERRGRSPMTGRYVSRDGSYDGGYDGSRRGGRSMDGGEVREKLRHMMEQTDDEHVKSALREAMRGM